MLAWSLDLNTSAISPSMQQPVHYETFLILAASVSKPSDNKYIDTGVIPENMIISILRPHSWSITWLINIAPNTWSFSLCWHMLLSLLLCFPPTHNPVIPDSIKILSKHYARVSFSLSKTLILCFYFYYSIYQIPGVPVHLSTRRSWRQKFTGSLLWLVFYDPPLTIVAPKEKLQGQRVTKVITIHPHTNSPLCYVAVFEEYKHRIASSDCHTAHPLFPKTYQLFSATSINFSVSILDQQPRSRYTTCNVM